MKTIRNILLIVLALALFAGGIFIGEALFDKSNGNNSATTLRTSLEEVCNLSVYEYTCREVVVHDGDGYKYDFTGLSENKFIATVDVTAQIGVKLTDKNYSVDVSDPDNIKVTVPHCKILDVNASQESVKTIEDKNGWFNNMDFDDYNDPVVEAKKQVKDQAKEDGVLDKADKRLKKIIKNHVQTLYPDANVKVTFK